MGSIQNTLNSSRDEYGNTWIARFQKNGCKGCTSVVHKARKYCRHENQRAIVRTFPKSNGRSKLLCDVALKKVEVAKEIIKAFNQQFSGKYCVTIRMHSVLEVLIDCKHDEWCLIEDRCHKTFIYFVDRYGKPIAAKFQILQTLVHFSYHYTKGKLIITNLKGCRDSKSFTLSIPTIHSVSEEFGPKDEGFDGIEKCLERHICNNDCAAFLTHEPETETKKRRPSAPPYDPELDEDKEESYKRDRYNDNLGFTQSEMTMILSRVPTQRSPVDLKLDLKNTEDFKPPPPYSPIDPNPPSGELSNHSPNDDQWMALTLAYYACIIQLSATEPTQCNNYDDVFNRDDDVFR